MRVAHFQRDSSIDRSHRTSHTATTMYDVFFRGKLSPIANDSYASTLDTYIKDEFEYAISISSTSASIWVKSYWILQKCCAT